MLEEELLTQLASLKQQAFKDGTPDIKSLKRIKGELFKIKKNKRDFLKPFVQELKESLFKNSISIPGLDFETFFQDSKTNFTVDKGITVEVKIDDEEVGIAFNELLKRLLECIQETLSEDRKSSRLNSSHVKKSNTAS